MIGSSLIGGKMTPSTKSGNRIRIFLAGILTISLQAAPKSVIAQVNRVKGIVFINELPAKGTVAKPTSRLLQSADSEPGTIVDNHQSMRDFLGPQLKSITILQVHNLKTHDKFAKVKSIIIEALQKSPKKLYRYEPWANGVPADIIARINYSDGKSGELHCTEGYLCVQDHSGKHWWMRYTSPDDVNETPVE